MTGFETQEEKLQKLREAVNSRRAAVRKLVTDMLSFCEAVPTAPVTRPSDPPRTPGTQWKEYSWVATNEWPLAVPCPMCKIDTYGRLSKRKWERPHDGREARVYARSTSEPFCPTVRQCVLVLRRLTPHRMPFWKGWRSSGHDSPPGKGRSIRLFRRRLGRAFSNR
jgi:hypothetical protein